MTPQDCRRRQEKERERGERARERERERRIREEVQKKRRKARDTPDGVGVRGVAGGERVQVPAVGGEAWKREPVNEDREGRRAAEDKQRNFFFGACVVCHRVTVSGDDSGWQRTGPSLLDTNVHREDVCRQIASKRETIQRQDCDRSEKYRNR